MKTRKVVFKVNPHIRIGGGCDIDANKMYQEQGTPYQQGSTMVKINGQWESSWGYHCWNNDGDSIYDNTMSHSEECDGAEIDSSNVYLVEFEEGEVFNNRKIFESFEDEDLHLLKPMEHPVLYGNTPHEDVAKIIDNIDKDATMVYINVVG